MEEKNIRMEVMAPVLEKLVQDHQNMLPRVSDNLKKTYKLHGGVTGLVAGLIAGGTLGAQLGIAGGPLGAIAGTVPGAIVGGIVGYFGLAEVGSKIDRPD